MVSTEYPTEYRNAGIAYYDNNLGRYGSTTGQELVVVAGDAISGYLGVLVGGRIGEVLEKPAGNFIGGVVSRAVTNPNVSAGIAAAVANSAEPLTAVLAEVPSDYVVSLLQNYGESLYGQNSNPGGTNANK